MERRKKIEELYRSYKDSSKKPIVIGGPDYEVCLAADFVSWNYYLCAAVLLHCKDVQHHAHVTSRHTHYKTSERNMQYVHKMLVFWHHHQYFCCEMVYFFIDSISKSFIALHPAFNGHTNKQFLVLLVLLYVIGLCGSFPHHIAVFVMPVLLYNDMLVNYDVSPGVIHFYTFTIFFNNGDNSLSLKVLRQ